jgi:hypothetical protein
MHAKLMQALADEQLKFLQKSAPGKVSTPEFLKPYLQERAEATQREDDIAAFSTAETGPLPIIHARRKRRKVSINQFAVLGLAAAILIMLMTGGLTSLLMLARNNPTSISKNSASLARPAEVNQKLYTSNTAYAHVVSALPQDNYVYYTAYGDGKDSSNWMLEQFDRTTQTSKPLLNASASDTLVVLAASSNWVVWLDYANPTPVTHGSWPSDGTRHAHLRDWSIYYLSLLPQQGSDSSTSTSGAPQTSPSDSQGQETVTTTLPAPTLLSHGTFDSDTAPSWVTTPIQGSWLTADTLLVAQIDQHGVSRLKSYLLGQTGKAAQAQVIAQAEPGHVLTWPTANSTGMDIYWADEWETNDGTLHSNIWQQLSSDETVRSQGHMVEQMNSTQSQLTTDGLSFQPQVVADNLFLLSTSEVTVSGQGAVKPNGIPLPVTATDPSVITTPRTDQDLYPAPVDASLHGSVFMIPLSGLNVGDETMLSAAGEATGLQTGSNYAIWQSASGYTMYDAQRHANVVVGDVLNNAGLLAVNGDTTIWLTGTNTDPSSSQLAVMAFDWPN